VGDSRASIRLDNLDAFRFAQLTRMTLYMAGNGWWYLTSVVDFGYDLIYGWI